MKQNCLIVDDMHPAIFTILQEAGIDTLYKPDWSREQILGEIEHFEGIIVRSKLILDKEFFSRAAVLKYIGRAGAGKDNIDLNEAESRGIAVLNAPEGNRDAVAEHVIGMLLNLLNRITIADSEVKNGIWKREANRGIELSSLTAGILGFGNTGQEVARRLVSFGCKVLAYDINGIKNQKPGVETPGIEHIFEEADILSIHIPLDEQNRNLVDRRFLEKFKKPIWLINTARGEIVKTRDLVHLLQTGKVLGAGLDVLENERLDRLTEEQKNDFDALRSMPNVILTPHVAGWTFDSYRKISETLGKKIVSFCS